MNRMEINVNLVMREMDFNWVGKDDPMLVAAYILSKEVTSDSEISKKYFYTIVVDEQKENTDPKERTPLVSIGSQLYDEYDHCVMDMNSKVKQLYIRGNKWKE